MTEFYQNIVNQSILLADLGVSQLNEDIYFLNGMSSPKIKRFLNNVCRALGPHATYLEVGSWRGSTIISASYKNKNKAICIDNFSEFNRCERFCVNPLIELLPENQRDFFLPLCTPREELLDKIGRYCNHVRFIEGDFNDKKTAEALKDELIDVYLYDGEHTFDSQYNGINNIIPYTNQTFILCVDDWTMNTESEARLGTMKAIADNNLKVLYEYHGFSNGNGDIENWWNGFYIGIISK